MAWPLHCRRDMTRVAVAVALLALSLAPPVPAAQNDCKLIDDFSKSKVGEFPSDWKPRKDAGKSIYAVQEEGGRRFLRATAKNQGIQAAREVEGWDGNEYPVLAWSWRPREFPKGADERQSGTNDSVLAVYMLVPYSKVTGPKAVKYVWSEKVPKDTRLSSNNGLTQVRVLRSGASGGGEWQEERVNVVEEFKKAFESKDTPKPAGIAVLTDSDDTKSSASGDYANFRICKR
jgi:DUF3047 family protein